MNFNYNSLGAQRRTPNENKPKVVAPPRDPFLNIYNETTPVGKLVKELYNKKRNEKMRPVNTTHRNSLKKIANVGDGSIYKFVKDITDSLYKMILTDNTKLNKILKDQIVLLMENGAKQYRANTGNSGGELAIAKKMIETTIGTEANPGLLKNTFDSFAAGLSYALAMRKEPPSLENALCYKFENYSPEQFRTLIINVCLKLIGYFGLLNTTLSAVAPSSEQPSKLSGVRNMVSFALFGTVAEKPMQSLRFQYIRPKLEEAMGKEQLEALLEIGPMLVKKLEALIQQIKVLQKIYGEPVIQTQLEKESADTIARIQRLASMTDEERVETEFLENMQEVNEVLLEVTKAMAQLGITYFVFTNGAMIALARILFTGGVGAGVNYLVGSQFTSPFLVDPITKALTGGRRHTKKQKRSKKHKRRHTKKH